MTKVQGRIKESADGLRSRSRESDRRRKQQAQERVAREATTKREHGGERKGRHGKLG